MDSRSKNGVRNVAAGFINRAVQMVLPFITRTLIVYYLGEKFLGLGGYIDGIEPFRTWFWKRIGV